MEISNHEPKYSTFTCENVSKNLIFSLKEHTQDGDNVL